MTPSEKEAWLSNHGTLITQDDYTGSDRFALWISHSRRYQFSASYDETAASIYNKIKEELYNICKP